MVWSTCRKTSWQYILFLRIVIENSIYFLALQISRCWDKCHNLQSWSGRASLVLTRFVFIPLFSITHFLSGWMYYTFFSFSDSEIVCSFFRKAAPTWSNYLELKVISTIPRKDRSKSRELCFLQAPQKWPPWIVKVLFDDLKQLISFNWEVLI